MQGPNLPNPVDSFHNWLENARDWSASHSCFWGTPLPIWISDDEEEMVVIGSIQEPEKLFGFKVCVPHVLFIQTSRS